MHAIQEPSALVLQSATGHFRGKWVDTEVFGHEGRDGGTRYLLFCDDYHDPFRPGRNGPVRVVATSSEEKGFCFSCCLDLAKDRIGQSGSSESKQITLSGCALAIAPIIANMGSILVPGRANGFSGTQPPEPFFWFSPLSGFPDLNSEPHVLPEVKTYRRRVGDLRERSRRFSDKWVELEPGLIPETAAPAVLSAFFIASEQDNFSGELWIAKEGQTSFALCVEARSGDSGIDLRETGEDLELLRGLGLRWASAFSLIKRHLVLPSC